MWFLDFVLTYCTHRESCLGGVIKQIGYLVLSSTIQHKAPNNVKIWKWVRPFLLPSQVVSCWMLDKIAESAFYLSKQNRLIIFRFCPDLSQIYESSSSYGPENGHSVKILEVVPDLIFAFCIFSCTLDTFLRQCRIVKKHGWYTWSYFIYLLWPPKTCTGWSGDDQSVRWQFCFIFFIQAKNVTHHSTNAGSRTTLQMFESKSHPSTNQCGVSNNLLDV